MFSDDVCVFLRVFVCLSFSFSPLFVISGAQHLFFLAARLDRKEVCRESITTLTGERKQHHPKEGEEDITIRKEERKARLSSRRVERERESGGRQAGAGCRCLALALAGAWGLGLGLGCVCWCVCVGVPCLVFYEYHVSLSFLSMSFVDPCLLSIVSSVYVCKPVQASASHFQPVYATHTRKLT